MFKKCFVYGDLKNQPRFSSNIIITSLNDALKELGLYDENGVKVCYSCVCDEHHLKADAFICSYEIVFSNIILNLARNRPILGVSKDNQKFITEGGYPAGLTDYFLLGVNTDIFPPIRKKYNLDSFSIGVFTESLSRGGIDRCIQAVGELKNEFNIPIKLRIKDRNSTDKFQEYVKERASFYNLDIDYINCHWSNTQDIINWFEGNDAALYLNFGSTYALPPVEQMAVGLPLITIAYSGPREYAISDFTALTCEYELSYVDEDLPGLLEIGTRNFFFPSGYKQRPVWAKANINSVKTQIMRVYSDKDLYNKVSEGGVNFTKNMTWAKSAANLSLSLSKWF